MYFFYRHSIFPQNKSTQILDLGRHKFYPYQFPQMNKQLPQTRPDLIFSLSLISTQTCYPELSLILHMILGKLKYSATIAVVTMSESEITNFVEEIYRKGRFIFCKSKWRLHSQMFCLNNTSMKC